jgi:hypothetical protein
MTTTLPDVPRPSLLRYAGMPDREIVNRAQRGDKQAEEFLLYKYRNLVKTKVKSYFWSEPRRMTFCRSE